jgi:hypothetical protein
VSFVVVVLVIFGGGLGDWPDAVMLMLMAEAEVGGSVEKRRRVLATVTCRCNKNPGFQKSSLKEISKVLFEFGVLNLMIVTRVFMSR